MKINHFEATNVHGHLNYDINFFSDLTFLIGINGAGKTTALKLILGLISPSYQFLSQIEFGRALLICSTNENEKDIEISASQNPEDQSFIINLKYQGREIPSPKIKRFIRSNFDNVDRDEFSVIEQTHREEFEILEVSRAIRDLATPKFLGLDRRVYEGRSIDARSRLGRSLLMKRKRGIDSNSGAIALDQSLEEAQFLIFNYLRSIAYTQPTIAEDFKKRIFQLSFNYIDDANLETLPEDISSIIDKRDRVLKAISDLDLEYLRNQVNSFFGKIIDIIQKNNELNKPNQPSVNFNSERISIISKWVNNASQLRRIDDIIKFSQRYQESVAKLRTPIRRFEEICEDFLKEANKTIRIAKDGEMQVKLPNNEEASVYELSSGEKQIIIMIAHLVFEEDQKPSGVFIIDEPELSLHITWQQIFVDSILKASPKTQFILATHSPSIIAKVEREQRCQDLSKLNS